MRELPFLGACLIVVAMTSAAFGADRSDDMLLSVAKPGGQPTAASAGAHAKTPSAHAASPFWRESSSAAPSKGAKSSGQANHGAAAKAAGTAKTGQAAAAAGTAGNAQAATAGSATKAQGEKDNDEGAVSLPPPGATQLLTQAYSDYKSNPNAASQAELLRLFKQLLLQAGAKTPAANLIKSTPVLADMGWRAIDAGGGRVWTTSRLPDVHDVVLQWADSKPLVSYVGRRHRIRKVTYAITWHVGGFVLPTNITLQEARILGSAEGSHVIILVGAESGSSLWLRSYRQSAASWVETASNMDSIPSFLTNNVSGKVTFRGPDLIFSVGRVVPEKTEDTTSRLPAAESSTYKFWLHQTDQGYVLMPQLVDEAQFATVRAFLEALAASRTDIAKSLLTDSRLLSIPKYVGLRGPSPNFRVAQMCSPPSGAPRYRLVTGGKDDLIFEVVHIKDKALIRSIFIAPADKFLQEVASHLPSYEKLAPPSPAADQVSVDKH